MCGPAWPTRLARFASLLVLVVACGGGAGGGGTSENSDLETFAISGVFSVEKPKGWSVVTAGSCETFAFLVRDPQEPLRQIFYFGTIGPIYASQAQKDLDEWYVAHGGYPPPWLDAPAVDPFTPANLMANWPAIADMNGAAAFMAEFPHLEGLELVSTTSRTTMLPGVAGTATAETRGIFHAGSAVAEGMFLATVAGPSALLCPDPQHPANPSACTGNGHFVCGVTMPKPEFQAKLDLLVASLDSFTISQDYVNRCIAQAQREWGAVAQAGRTLSEASDILWDGWVARTRAEDVTAEEYSDGFLGVDRVYDPSTGDVYSVPTGWYEIYDASRSSYDMQGLELLPGDASYWDLWMKATLDQSHIH